MTSLTDPDPEQSKTRTPTTLASFATPVVLPTAVPATCVPCPSQSSALGWSSTKSYPWAALDFPESHSWNSWCVLRSPESTVYIVTPFPALPEWVYLPSRGSDLWSTLSKFHRATLRSCTWLRENALTWPPAGSPEAEGPPPLSLASRAPPMSIICLVTGYSVDPPLWIRAAAASSALATRCSALYTILSFSTKSTAPSKHVRSFWSWPWEKYPEMPRKVEA
mmetsp:Transcript_6646/g.19491  ORF Transcript_6646/g.19491 Transcript_6646/m.19491 type:complete len:222 (-) Transcript_6646:689-1354(-)